MRFSFVHVVRAKWRIIPDSVTVLDGSCVPIAAFPRRALPRKRSVVEPGCSPSLNISLSVLGSLVSIAEGLAPARSRARSCWWLTHRSHRLSTRASLFYWQSASVSILAIDASMQQFMAASQPVPSGPVQLSSEPPAYQQVDMSPPSSPRSPLTASSHYPSSYYPSYPVSPKSAHSRQDSGGKSSLTSIRLGSAGPALRQTAAGALRTKTQMAFLAVSGIQSVVVLALVVTIYVRFESFVKNDVLSFRGIETCACSGQPS